VKRAPSRQGYRAPGRIGTVYERMDEGAAQEPQWDTHSQSSSHVKARSERKFRSSPRGTKSEARKAAELVPDGRGPLRATTRSPSEEETKSVVLKGDRRNPPACGDILTRRRHDRVRVQRYGMPVLPVELCRRTDRDARSSSCHHHNFRDDGRRRPSSAAFQTTSARSEPDDRIRRREIRSRVPAASAHFRAPRQSNP